MALSRIAKAERIASLAEHPSADVRLAAVVALQRQKSGLVASFLGDASDRVVLQAARAIHDLPIEFAEPELAGLIERQMNSDAIDSTCSQCKLPNRR